MTKNEKALDFLERHGMNPESVDPDVYIYRMLTEMKSGLAGEECSMDMIPTYLSNDGTLPPDVQCAVIDAGRISAARLCTSNPRATRSRT